MFMKTFNNPHKVFQLMLRYKKPNLIYKSLKKSSKSLEAVLKDKRKIILLLITVILLLIIFTKLKPVFFTAFLILLGGISMLYVRFFNFAHYLGVELCMMATVLTSLAYGPGVGAFTGFTYYTHLLMAAAVLSIVPVLIFFLFAQRQFIEGMTMTGLKG